MTKLLFGVFAMLLCLTLGIPAFSGDASLPEKVDLYYIYDGQHNTTEAFDAYAAQKLADIGETYPYEIHRVDVFTGAGHAHYEALCRAMALDAATVTLPALIAGGRIFQSDVTIEKNLAEAYLVAGEDLFVNGKVYNPAEKKTGPALFDDYTADPAAATVVYFYRITCPECIETTPVIDALGADVIRINTRSGNNGERIAAFFDAYSVPDEDRIVPVAFTKDQYFAGYEMIATGLADAIASSEPGFVFPSL